MRASSLRRAVGGGAGRGFALHASAASLSPPPPRSGAEDRHGYIWDRHYDVCLAKLRHEDVVNSVAFSPVEQELLLTASDDSTIKVWRSPRTVRLLQVPKPRLRRPFFSWAPNQRS